MTKKIYTNNKAFTLLEMTIVLAIICALTTVVGVRVVESVRILAAEKTAREMKVIQDAAKAYYVDNKAWPASIAVLKTGGYLASAWTTNNPFGNAYNISTSGSSFQVSTNLQTNYHGVITANLPSVTTSGDTATSTIPIPGSESSSSTIPSGAILIFNGAACPSGYTRVSSLDNYFIMGGTSFGSTGGSTTHNHGGTTGGESGMISDNFSMRDITRWTGNHTHSISSANHLPTYTTVLFCQKD